jgi:hypothetical protein
MMEGITNEEEEIFLTSYLNLFSQGTITLFEPKILSVVIFNAKVSTKDLTFNFPDSKGEILIDTTLARIKVQELEITQWTLLEDHHVQLFNLGIIKKY